MANEEDGGGLGKLPPNPPGTGGGGKTPNNKGIKKRGNKSAGNRAGSGAGSLRAPSSAHKELRLLAPDGTIYLATLDLAEATNQEVMQHAIKRGSGAGGNKKAKSAGGKGGKGEGKGTKTDITSPAGVLKVLQGATKNEKTSVARGEKSGKGQGPEPENKVAKEGGPKGGKGGSGVGKKKTGTKQATKQAGESEDGPLSPIFQKKAGPGILGKVANQVGEAIKAVKDPVKGQQGSETSAAEDDASNMEGGGQEPVSGGPGKGAKDGDAEKRAKTAKHDLEKAPERFKERVSGENALPLAVLGIVMLSALVGTVYFGVKAYGGDDEAAAVPGGERSLKVLGNLNRPKDLPDANIDAALADEVYPVGIQKLEELSGKDEIQSPNVDQASDYDNIQASSQSQQSLDYGAQGAAQPAANPPRPNDVQQPQYDVQQQGAGDAAAAAQPGQQPMSRYNMGAYGDTGSQMNRKPGRAKAKRKKSKKRKNKSREGDYNSYGGGLRGDQVIEDVPPAPPRRMQPQADNEQNDGGAEEYSLDAPNSVPKRRRKIRPKSINDDDEDLA